MNNIILYIIVIIIFSIIINNLTCTIITIYNNTIFKLIFLFLLYTIGDSDHVLLLILFIYYVYLDKIIREKQLLYNI